MKIPHDKKLHLAAGAAVAVAALVLGLGETVALGLAALAGVGKEVYDWVVNRRRKAKGLTPLHTVDHYDAIVTLVGGALIVIAVDFVRWVA